MHIHTGEMNPYQRYQFAKCKVGHVKSFELCPKYHRRHREQGCQLLPSISCGTQHQTLARLQLIWRYHFNLPFNQEHLGDALSSIFYPHWEPN